MLPHAPWLRYWLKPKAVEFNQASMLGRVVSVAEMYSHINFIMRYGYSH